MEWAFVSCSLNEDVIFKSFVGSVDHPHAVLFMENIFSEISAVFFFRQHKQYSSASDMLNNIFHPLNKTFVSVSQVLHFECQNFLAGTSIRMFSQYPNEEEVPRAYLM